jgi:hypothetical protein
MEEFFNCSYLPEGYLINRFGQIKSPFNKILKTNISNSGYICISIKNKGYFIHRALMFCFSEIDENKTFVNHKDGNKLNNCLSNLEWCTKSDNTKHAYELGLKKETVGNLYKGKFGNKHNRSKSVIYIETGEVFGSMSEASRNLDISISSVSWSIKHKKPIFGMHFEIKE